MEFKDMKTEDGNVIKFNVSKQAEVMIAQLKDFDEADYKKYILKNLPVGSSNILEYLLHKDKTRLIR